MIICFSHGEGKKVQENCHWCCLSILWSNGNLYLDYWCKTCSFFFSIYCFVFFFVDVLRLCLVPSGVFIAVFSHAGGRLYIELKES